MTTGQVVGMHDYFFLQFAFILSFLTFILVSSLHLLCPFFVLPVAFSTTTFIAISFFVFASTTAVLVFPSSRYRPFEIITQSPSFC